MSDSNVNNNNEGQKLNNIIINQNQKAAKIIKHYLDYLPTILIRLIFEKNIMTNEKIFTPLEHKFNSCFLYIDFSEINIDYLNNNTINKEYYEYIYTNINKNIEEICSILIENNCDFICFGRGILSFIPPNFYEGNFVETDNTKIFNKIIKIIQCSLEIKKNYFEFKKFLKIKMGISFGECKLIILDNNLKNTPNNDKFINKHSFINVDFIMTDKNNPYISNKNRFLNSNNSNLYFYYFLFGKCLSNCCEFAKIGEEGQIIIDQLIYNSISDYFDVEEIHQEKRGKLYKIIKEIQQIKLQNKTVNNNKLNYLDKLLLSKRDLIGNFYPNFVFKTLSEKGHLINGKWIKENKYITILMLRPSMKKQNLNEIGKINQLIKIISNIINELGGLMFKIMNDEKGIVISLIFGLKKFISKNKDELISVIFAFEVAKKLKEINIYPFIGISSNLALLNVNKFSGGRRDLSIIGNAMNVAFQCLEESEKIFYNKNNGEDAIVIDKNTMEMIDSLIPCRYYKKVKNNFLKNDLFLFIPLKTSKIHYFNQEENVIPLIGSHLHFLTDYNNISEEEINIINEKKYLNFYYKQDIIHIVNLLKNYIQKNNTIKIININGFNGCGKTLFLSQSLNTFFRDYPIFKDLLEYNNVKNDFPFLFFSNLPIIIYSKNNYNKREFKAIQHIIREIFDYLYEEVKEKYKIIELIKKNNCLEFLTFLGNFFGDKVLKVYFKNIYPEDKQNISLINEEEKNNIYSLFIDILNQYYFFINNIHKEKLNQYNIKIPIIIIIESLNLSDKYSLDFLRYYLTNNSKSNNILFITTNSIPLFPQYIYQQKNIIEPFYKLGNNKSFYQYEISILNGKEKMNYFIINFFKEKKDILVEKASDIILNFLIHKTYGGIQEQVIRFLLYLYDNKYIYVKKINEVLTLIENEQFNLMLKRNDFIDLLIPYSIEKNIYNIINKELNIEEIALLRICAVLGDLFDTVKLSKILKNNGYSYINSFNEYWKQINNCSSKEFNLYESLLELEKKNVIEILFDMQTNHKFVVCKFSIPFMREILYQCTSLDQRNELHYIIGKIIKNKIDIKSDYAIYKYYNDELDLLNLKNHLKKMEIFMHDYNTRKINKYEEKNKNISEENFSLNNLKTILIREISIKLLNTKNDKNTVIKSGYLEKKSDGKITWEKRFFILTPNKFSYYYSENDYKSNAEPLGFFYLKNLYDVKVLRNDDKFIFCLTVNEWIKKKELMTERIYVLNSEKWEDLYIWTISLKILKIKAFYDSFFTNRWYINFPLFETGRENEKSELMEYVFKLNISDNSLIDSDKDEIKRKEGINNRVKQRKQSFIGLSFKESNSFKKRTFHLYIEIIFNYFRFLIRYAFSSFLNNIQIKIQDINNIDINEYDFIENSFLLENEKTNLKQYLELITFNNENLKIKIEEEKKNAFIYTNKESEYMSEKYNNYIKKYYPFKGFGEHIIYKIRDLKKIADYNRIITTKNYDEIEFIEEQEENVKNEDNLRFGDYTDITAPYPINKFNSNNNNIFINDVENGERKRKRSINLTYRGESTPLQHNDEDVAKESLNESHKSNKNNLSTFLKNMNNSEEKIRSSEIWNENNISGSKKDNASLNLNEKNSRKSEHSNLSKDNTLESIKEEPDIFKTKKNKSFISSSLSSKGPNSNQKEKIKKEKKSNNKEEKEDLNSNKEKEKIIFQNYDEDNNSKNSKKSKDKKSSLLSNDQKNDFGKLLIDYSKNIKIKRMKARKTGIINIPKSRDSKGNNNTLKFSFNNTKGQINAKENGNIECFVEKNISNKDSNNEEIKKINNSSNSNSSNNSINNNNKANNNSINQNVKRFSNKNDNNSSNRQNNCEKKSIEYNRKNSSLKDIFIKDTKLNKNESKSNETNANDIISLYSEEEPSIGKVNCSMNQLSINNFFSKKIDSISEVNNYSIIEKNKKHYNKYLISFFSKNKAKNQPSNKTLNDKTKAINQKAYLKDNKNLKLWLLLNKSKKNKNNKIERNSLNKNNKEEFINSEEDIIDSLNESYSYIKNFIFDNHRDTKKHCQLRKKVLVEINPKKNINNIKYKNNNDLEMIQKLKNKSISLDQEKEYIGYLKDILQESKQKNINEYNKLNSYTSRSKSSNNYDNSTSNNTYREQFYYPNVFYLNEKENLHKKTHISYLFSKLRANNNFK